MRKVAIIASTVGYHWEEVFGAYKEFKEAGWAISLYTVDGKPAVADPRSLEKKPLLSLIGLGLNDSISPETDLGKEISYRMGHEVQPVELLFAEVYDAIYLPGGHGCLFDVNVNPIVQDKILEAYQKEKVISAVCHGSSALAFVRDNGRSIIAGKKITGFPDFMDTLLLLTKWIHPKFLPLPYRNEEAMKKAGAAITWINTLLSIVNIFYYRKDLPFITGVGPKAAGLVAKDVIRSIEELELKKEEAVFA